MNRKYRRDGYQTGMSEIGVPGCFLVTVMDSSSIADKFTLAFESDGPSEDEIQTRITAKEAEIRKVRQMKRQAKEGK